MEHNLKRSADPHARATDGAKLGALLQLLDDSLYVGAAEPLNCWLLGLVLRQWIAVIMAVGEVCVCVCRPIMGLSASGPQTERREVVM